MTVITTTQNKKTAYLLYLTAISAIGIGLITVGIGQVFRYDEKLNFLLLLILAAVSQAIPVSVTVGRTSVTYEIHNAVSIAAVLAVGPGAAVIIVTVADLVLWLIKPAAPGHWKRSLKQLAFNVGMHSIAVFLAGSLLLALRGWLGASTLWGETLPWLAAAITADQINIWLLIGVLRLQHGAEMNPLVFWRSNRWAMPINILIMAVGGWILAYAMVQLDAIGILIFFLPVFLSAYAFRLYVQQTQGHMKDLENIIAARTAELQGLMREKDAFLAVLTHDMKSPLTSISLYAELIRRKPEIVLEKPHMAETIMRSQETLRNIVDNILDLETLQVTGSMPLEQEIIDLIPLLENTLESIRPQAEQKEISLVAELETGEVQLHLDKNQIERLFYNLLSNAIKYTSEQGHVCVTVTRQSAGALIAIRDTGYGIPAEELPYVFDRFHRVAKHKHKAVGTGLGLAVSKAIVAAHNGRIDVVSEEGKGSTFTIHLPSYHTPAREVTPSA